MPIYEFECASCGHRFDRLQKLSDDDPTICPSCGAPQLKRRVSAPSFRLAGSGWRQGRVFGEECSRCGARSSDFRPCGGTLDTVRRRR